MKAPKKLSYTKDHEWVKVSGDKAYIGITDYAQKALGSIVYVELPEVESDCCAGEVFAVVESVKAASDVYAPIDGKVLEVNEEVVNDPALLNEDPYENWMVCVEISDSTQIDDLMDASEYKDFCTDES